MESESTYPPVTPPTTWQPSKFFPSTELTRFVANITKNYPKQRQQPKPTLRTALKVFNIVGEVCGTHPKFDRPLKHKKGGGLAAAAKGTKKASALLKAERPGKGEKGPTAEPKRSEASKVIGAIKRRKTTSVQRRSAGSRKSARSRVSTARSRPSSKASSRKQPRSRAGSSVRSVPPSLPKEIAAKKPRQAMKKNRKKAKKAISSRALASISKSSKEIPSLVKKTKIESGTKGTVAAI